MQRPVGADRVELIRVGQQAEQQVAQRAVRGLDPGGQQQPEEREDLLVDELLPVDLGRREAADQVVARLLPTGREDRPEVLRQRLRRREPRSGLTVKLSIEIDQRWNCGKSSCGQAEQAAMMRVGYGKGELLTRSALPRLRRTGRSVRCRLGRRSRPPSAPAPSA